MANSEKFPRPSERPVEPLSPKLTDLKDQIAQKSGLDPETVETVLKTQQELGLEPERTPESQSRRNRELEEEAQHGGIRNPWERIDVETYDAKHHHDGILDRYRYTIMDMEHWNGMDDERRIFAVTNSPFEARQLLEKASDGFQPKPFTDRGKPYDFYEDMDWVIWEENAGFVGQKHFDGVERSFTTTVSRKLEQAEEEARKPVYFLYDRNQNDINQEYSLGEDPHTPDEVLTDLEQVIQDYSNTDVARFDAEDPMLKDFERYGDRRKNWEQQYDIYCVPQGLFDDLHEFNDFWGREFDHQEPEATVSVVTPLALDPEEGALQVLEQPEIQLHGKPEFTAKISSSLQEELHHQGWTLNDPSAVHEVDLQSGIARGAEQRDHQKEPGPEPRKQNLREKPVTGGNRS